VSRFTKKNQVMIIVLGISSLVVLVFFVIAVIKYIEMASDISEIEKLDKKIKAFYTYTPRPHDDNKPILNKNKALYDKALDRMLFYFTNPLSPAVDEFIKIVMSVKKGESLVEARKTFLEKYNQMMEKAKNSAEKQLYFEDFKKSYGSKWDKGIDAFVAKAKSITLEPDLEKKADEVVLAAMGVPRMFQYNFDHFKQYKEAYRNKIISLMQDRVMPDAEHFSLPKMDEYVDEKEFPAIATQLDLISHLINYIGSTKVSLLVAFKLRKQAGTYASSITENGSYRITHYTFEVVGSMEELRKLTKVLEEAYKNHHVYIVRSVFLYAKESENTMISQVLAPAVQEEDNKEAVAKVVTNNEGRRGRRGRSFNRQQPVEEANKNSDAEDLARRRAEAERLFKEQQAKLKYHERVGYGEVQVGESKEYHAIFDIDCVYFSGN
jgi:hypothetical protein